MRMNYQQLIQEDPGELKQIQMQQKDVSSFQKIQGLYLLKTGKVKTVSSLAEYLGVHRVTLQRWLRSYRDQGLEGLLTVKPKTGRPKTIEDRAIAQLQEKLNEKKPVFKSYGEIKDWLENNYQIKVNYHTVYYWVKYKLKVNL